MSENRENYTGDRKALGNIDLKGKNILVVDDNELNRNIAAEMLAITGAVIICAEDGAEAVKIFKERGDDFFRLILMDINMPNMNGYEAAGAIRSIGTAYSGNIPIIACTSEILLDEDINTGIISGMNGAINKPIVTEQLCAVLKQWVS